MDTLFAPLLKSFIHYPSCIFWAWVLIPALRPLLYLIFYYLEEPYGLSSIPMEHEAFKFNELLLICQIIEIINILMEFQVFYFIRRSFTKCITHAAPRAKLLFGYYSNIMIIPMGIYILTSFIKYFISIKDYPYPFVYNYALNYGSHLWFIRCFNQMERIKNGEVCASGYSCFIVLCIMDMIILASVYANVIHNYTNWIKALGAYTSIISNIIAIALNSIIAMAVLGNRFIRIPEAV